ncbi:MAG: rhomboid family intramembrane serine protease [Bacteroidetes bacterium]|nr:rhomboid family intramembrane serine protease [Bacteroidota bacterium]MDA0902743.1 rhomboid family intramembrane serine protease [Bacteroidota bacterium]MDA1241824.1 rhomboid family intramembrane serine protease [Bacteroidota bacterium]
MTVVHAVVAATVLTSWWAMDRPAVKKKLLLVPYRIKQGGEWQRLVTHGFIHADWMHLAFNMFVLFEFGRTVESDLSSVEWLGFPALYAGGMISGALPALRKHGDNPSYASLGASGAVSAVLVAFVALHPTSTLLLFFVIPVPAVLAGVLFFWYEARMMDQGRGRVAHDAHLGGGMFGLLWVFLTVPNALAEMMKALQSLLG